VIVRTHGIPKQELEKLKKKNIEIIDATCPFVKKPQEIVEEMSKAGYDIVIFGDINHPEIKGVMSYSVHNRVFVVLNVEELKNKKLKERIATVAQTTRKIKDYLEITNYLIQNYKEVRVFNTICNATFENQDAVRELAKEADIMIIIGGKNSSNTKQLYNIAKEYSESYLIENENEINPEWFKDKNLCGISAGASTPEWLVEKIISKIKEVTWN
jgi:4-hydroxy-3-methylbut-2-enyl diphosphate reductase